MMPLLVNLPATVLGWTSFLAAVLFVPAGYLSHYPDAERDGAWLLDRDGLGFASRQIRELEAALGRLVAEIKSPRSILMKQTNRGLASVIATSKCLLRSRNRVDDPLRHVCRLVACARDEIFKTPVN